MILIDPAVGSKELEPLLRRLRVPCELHHLEFGDAGFEGKGPDGGSVFVGIERKALHDMLHCIDDARFAGHQLPGMKDMYDIRILMIEGHWKPHDPDGFLMEGYDGGLAFGYCRPGGQRVMYHKLKRYLMTVALSGVIVDYSRDLFHTAYNIHEWYQYFQKREHTSLLEVQKLQIPALMGKPSLVRRWAHEVDGLGVKRVEEVVKQFRSGYDLATADESRWLKLPGVGVKLARDIYAQIRGHKR